jgi:hypothetical protein
MPNSDKLLQTIANAGFAALRQTLHTPPLSAVLCEFQRAVRRQQTDQHPNPLTRKGQSYFSQNDEDGILLEILERLGLHAPGHFVEFGVGKGVENNTLILLMKGWHGFWVGGEDIVLDLKANEGKLRFNKGWITRENTAEHFGKACAGFGVKDTDVFSLDLDGNDIYVMEAVLAAGFRPKIIICEYNAKFPPPVEFRIAYDPGHAWNGSDYFGASLQSFVNLLAPQDYRLVACNITGANAFFVHKADAAAFADVPTAIRHIFVPANYGIVVGMGHPTAPQTIKTFL